MEKIFYPAILLLSYLIGSIPFGYIIGKINGIDIRKHGSGNIGATNILRALGKKWGYLCFSLDFLKGFIPVLSVSLIAKKYAPEFNCENAAILAFAGVYCGHVWTIFLGFKGGKGVATAAGAIFAAAPLPFAICLTIWLAVFFLSRYVSLASIAASAALPVSALAADKFRGQNNYSLKTLVFFCVIAGLSIIKHSSNIKKLINGSEHRFGRKEEKK
jgi:glycerol-3-phosphate acyltransferase PlsY